MQRIKNPGTMYPSPLKPHPLTLALAMACALPAQAEDFRWGDISGRFDSSLSIGASWGMRDADDRFIGVRRLSLWHPAGLPRRPPRHMAHPRLFHAQHRPPRGLPGLLPTQPATP